MKTLILLIILLMASVCNAAIYVDGTLGSSCSGQTYSIANRNCSGTDGPGYKTGQEAADVAQAGDTVYVRAGTYSPAGTFITTVRNGTSGSRIVFTAYGDEVPTINLPNTSAETMGFNNTGYSYITVNGFNIVGGTTGSNKRVCSGVPQVCQGLQSGILFYNGANYGIITNNTISQMSSSGIAIITATNATVDSNIVHDNVIANDGRPTTDTIWGAGITAGWGANYVTMTNNIVYFNHGEGMSCYAGSNNCTISGNLVADAYSTQLYCDASINCHFDKNFLYLTADARSVTTGNQPIGITFGVEDYGGGTNSINGFEASNNLVIGTTNCFYRWNSQSTVSDSNVTILENSCINNAEGMRFDVPGGGFSNHTIRNNLIVGGPLASGETMYWDPAPTATTFSNNLYYAIDQFKWGANTTNYAGWLTNSGETGSVNSNPNISTTVPCRLWVWTGHSAPCTVAQLQVQIANYALQAGSPAISAGANLGSPYNTDYAGNSRPAVGPWDMGAYEYQAPASNPVGLKVSATLKVGSGATLKVGASN